MRRIFVDDKLVDTKHNVIMLSENGCDLVTYKGDMVDMVFPEGVTSITDEAF